MITVIYRDLRTGLNCEENFTNVDDATWMMKEVNISDSLRGISVLGSMGKFFCGPSGVFYHDTPGHPSKVVGKDKWEK